jgi:hypothetical protein
MVLLLQFATVSAQQKPAFFDGALRIRPAQDDLGVQAQAAQSGPEIDKYFNFNPVVDFSKGVQQRYKNVVRQQSSVFVVFKSADEGENNLLSLERKSFKASIGNKKLVSGSEVKINRGNPKTGIIVGYFSSINSIPARKTGHLTIDDLYYADKDGKNTVMELIYIPTALNSVERNMVESYLSLAYGISLEQGKDYLDSASNKIWDAKEQGGFNSRVTGIGRDDAFGLYQRQSANSEADGVTIGIDKIARTNKSNAANIADRSFLVWADNGAATAYDKPQDGISRLKRQWKILPQGQPFKTQIKINQEKLPLYDASTSDLPVWLVVDTVSTDKIDYDKAQYIRARQQNNDLVFDGVTWNRASLFSFVKAPDFFMVAEVVASPCNTDTPGKLHLKLVGGTAPFNVHVVGNGVDKTIVVNADSADFENLPAGSYLVEATDRTGRKVSESFTTEQFPITEITLPARLYLETNGVEVMPTVKTDGALTYRWIFNEETISTERKILAAKPGIYQLTVSDPNGCENRYSTEIVEKPAGMSEGWVLSPNPVSAQESFSLRFSLKTPADIVVVITDVNGRAIKTKNLGSITEFEYRDALSASGTYFIQVIQNGIIQTGKLIVK